MNLRILNLNLGLLPWPLGIRHNCQRSKTMLNKILMMEPDELPDVICFQELTSRIARRIVTKGLCDLYPYHYVDTRLGRHLIGVNSGLAIFSRHPIVDKTLRTYSVYRGVENFARKGVMGVRLEIDKYDEDHVLYTTHLCVFTTHIQAGIGKEPCICKLFDRNQYTTAELKTKQVQESTEFVNCFVRPAVDEAVVFCGDFNIPAAEELYPMLRDTLMDECGLVDSYDADRSEIEGSVIGKPHKRIDYQFVSPQWLQGHSGIVTYFGPYGEVTDHYGVTGTYQLDEDNKK
jgi:endonuclease/exonuclease/phosphatase family metal-dependent hydrolase